jgi:hypothetical protein
MEWTKPATPDGAAGPLTFRRRGRALAPHVRTTPLITGFVYLPREERPGLNFDEESAQRLNEMYRSVDGYHRGAWASVRDLALD